MSMPADVDAVQVVKDVIAERDRLRSRVAEQDEELARLRREADELARERAQLVAREEWWRNAVHALSPKEDLSFTAEDVAEWQRTGLPLDAFIREIDPTFTERPADGATG